MFLVRQLRLDCAFGQPNEPARQSWARAQTTAHVHMLVPGKDLDFMRCAVVSRVAAHHRAGHTEHHDAACLCCARVQAAQV